VTRSPSVSHSQVPQFLGRRGGVVQHYRRMFGGGESLYRLP